MNDLSKVVDKLLAQGLLALRGTCVMPRLVNSDYSNLAAQQGASIDVPIPSAIKAQAVTPGATSQDTGDISPVSATIKLDRWMEAPFYLTDKDLMEANRGVIPMQASEAVKAIANEFAADGLRLVEVKKNQLYQIPDLMDKLAANPLKFILFIDDLSFTANDDNFAALKAILEGSVGGRARNIAVYATSNRRHLIKETLSDRTGDDIHEADTRQELMSLSARFGLTVTFQRPEKARFEVILTELAKQHGIEMPHDELLTKAEAFAIRAGGRSPRVAKQFIEQCAAGVQK